ncbi:hypothetical protein N7492_005562 [Penicillium capsulatum]|uniref:Mediator of RNA polymerase II transcription subunit 1 n=1 Tax=Penicillium capsulatum TaxID=69766 RepID=A0A9W9IBS4_9EURO|nr:hypothetical protein N7492_005562 [Penicillium capsulatum]KAJ6135338.1 hypothetical protein N7512_000498 [Penicillium capsulatum]
MATPSAKPGTTPTHLTPSPHPSSAPLSRSIAHKSPSTRTPTGSGAGNTHPAGTSSHQYSTPLAIASAVDDPVAFSSPSALLALGGYPGISPSPAVHDGLVGAGMNESDIQNLGMTGLKLGIARDSDEEQKLRIKEVVNSLRARVAGRGVSREGVERLSRLEGFESIWADNGINIAGNFVDLEIEFYAGHDVVKDVSLRYATPEYTEGERREEATAVLKRNLAQSPRDADLGKWRSLQSFHENLQWLAKLDKLSQEVNCFEALEGVEENLRRIWIEEGKTGKYGGDYEHLCLGVIGRPSMHKGSRIGLGLEYWVDQARVMDGKQQKPSSDAMAIDQSQNQWADDTEEQQNLWTVMIECEEGYPPLRISKEWVGNETFTAGEKGESPSPAKPESVNWLDPPQTMRLSHGNHPDPMALDSSMLESSPPNRRFVAKLEPALDVPILAASDIYRHLGMQLPQEFKMITYDDLLVSESSLVSTETPPQCGRRKRRMSVHAFSSTGVPSPKQHSYTFQAFESIAGRTIRDLPFSHPRQLADILPILRQYALLASLVRKIFQPAKGKDEKRALSKSTSTGSLAPTSEDSNPFTGQGGLITLSNDDPNEDRLNSLLSSGFAGSGLTQNDTSLRDGEDPKFADVKVDVTLRTQLGQAPALMLLITDPGEDGGNSAREPAQVSLSCEIGSNGRIAVVESAGLAKTEAGVAGEPGDTEMQGTDESGSKLQDLHRKIARVLEISQDLGILVEWILHWLRQRAVSR